MKHIFYYFILLVFFFIPALSDAHQSGCHRWHSCPSDTGSYVCGDLGYACQYSTYSNGSSNYNNYSYPNSSYTTSCPANSYASGSSCKCNYGHVVSGSSCVSGNTLCHSQLGIMSSYDSLSGKCKCDYGYVIGSSGSCVYESSYSNSYYGGYSHLSGLDCPAHSSENDEGGCSCDFGYKVNTNKDKCVKLTKKDNDKMCQIDFGKNSEWGGKYDKVNEVPYCKCKKKYKWSDDGESCIKITS